MRTRVLKKFKVCVFKVDGVVDINDDILAKCSRGINSYLADSRYEGLLHVGYFGDILVAYFIGDVNKANYAVVSAFRSCSTQYTRKVDAHYIGKVDAQIIGVEGSYTTRHIFVADCSLPRVLGYK